MSEDPADAPEEPKPSGQVIGFPYSRVAPGSGKFKDLGLSKTAQRLGSEGYLTGHWCSRCKGIWFGYMAEVECPVCGNRKG